jgi:hypothetical protein
MMETKEEKKATLQFRRPADGALCPNGRGAMSAVMKEVLNHSMVNSLSGPDRECLTDSSTSSGHFCDSIYRAVLFEREGLSVEMSVTRKSSFTSDSFTKDSEGNRFLGEHLEFKVNWSALGSVDCNQALTYSGLINDVAKLAGRLETMFGDTEIWTCISTAEELEQKKLEKLDYARRMFVAEMVELVCKHQRANNRPRYFHCAKVPDGYEAKDFAWEKDVEDCPRFEDYLTVPVKDKVYKVRCWFYTDDTENRVSGSIRRIR